MSDLLTLEDSELVALYLTGDSRAFSVFYERHGKKLFNFVRLKLASYKDEAEDITQKVWSEWLNQCLDDNACAEKLGPALLFTIAKSRAIDFLRKQGRTQSLDISTSDDESQSIDPEDDNALHADRQSELVHSVHQVIDQQLKQATHLVAHATNEFDKVKAVKKLEKITDRCNEQRTVFELAWMGYSLDVIEEMAGLSIDKVRYRQKELYTLLKDSDIQL
ncbi:MAG: hypothetical protein KBT66_06435 [Amphritea sp.]|nr:hypothetical protein [Amphritea sp.]